MIGRAATDLVRVANTAIPFVSACRVVGIYVPGGASERGTKIYCPFGVLHPDGGREKAFRVYYDHGFCYAEWSYYTPVGLAAAVWDCSQAEAAARLLEAAGVSNPNWQRRWRTVVDWSPPVDLGALREALRIWCESQCRNWHRLQYRPVVADALAACLGLLPRVSNDQDCALWLEASKAVMGRALRGLDVGD